MTVRFDRGEPALWRFDCRQRSLGAIDSNATMGARTGAHIVVTAPIEQVVTRLRAGPRMVRYLISRESCRLAQLLRELVERTRTRPIRDAQSAGGMARGERRALLDGELVEREVVRSVIEC